MHHPASLKIHEWMAITTIITVMCALTAFAVLRRSWNDSRAPSPMSAYAHNRIEVVVKGAVAHSGVYSLPKGMPMKELLEVAQLAPDADVRRFNLERVIQQGRVVNVPKRAMITVQVNGAVESAGEVTVPRGTTLEQLADKIALSEDADASSLRKKRKLKDGETITVKKKKAEG